MPEGSQHRRKGGASDAGERSKRSSIAPQGAGFLPDLKDLFQRYNKRTSAAHKRLVVLLVLVGTALRAWMLFLPITADEAFTFVHYAIRPAMDIIGDLKHPQNQVFHTLLVKWSTSLLGTDTITLRLPAFLASVLSMPLFYLFVRSMFNRYIAVLTLALVAGSGPLVEYGGIANAHAIVWLCMVIALVLGRHFTKENDPVSAIGMGFFLALGMWASPGGLYPALMVLLWSLFHLMLNHSDSLPARLRFWFAGFGVFLVLALLLYAPVINNHGLLQLFLHDSVRDLTWKRFKLVHTEGTMALWFHIVDTSARWFAILGFIGLIAAAYISQKYRILALAMLAGAAIPVLLVRHVSDPGTWTYSLYILHVSTAIALFYLLKYAQEKFVPKLGKRTRVAVASVVLLAATAWPAMTFLLTTDRLLRFPEAESMATYLDGAMDPDDRVHADLPWEDPTLFHLMEHGWGKGAVRGLGPEGSYLFVVVDPGAEQTISSVLALQAVPETRLRERQLVFEQGRVKIFAGPVAPEEPTYGPIDPE